MIYCFNVDPFSLFIMSVLSPSLYSAVELQHLILSLRFSLSLYFHSLFTLFFILRYLSSLFVRVLSPPVRCPFCASPPPPSLFPGGDRSLPYSLRPSLPKKMDSPSLIPCGVFYVSHRGADAGTVASMKE